MRYIDSAGARPGQAPDCVVYLDHAATTPMLPEALSAMTEELGQLGNPSSLHNAGRRARRVVEESREQIAEVFGARPSEVIFTSGGTEADNLAVKGLYWARRAAAVAPARPGAARPVPHRVLATSIEHHAVLDSAGWLAEHEQAEPGWLPVDAAGVLAPETLAEAIAEDPDGVALVTAMWANNEVGVVQQIPELAAIAREHGIPFHTDAVQAAGQLPVSFAASGVDAMTVTRTSSVARSAPARCCWPAASSRSRCCTVAARRARCARAPWTRRPSGRSPSRPRSWPAAGTMRPPGWPSSATN